MKGGRVRRVLLAWVLSAAVWTSARPAAAEPPGVAIVTPAAATAAAATRGLLVVAPPPAAGAAWPLAQAVYADATLRPASIDEAHARVLCGEAAPSGARGDLRDLAETVAAIQGDDAPSRTLLADIAQRWTAAAVVLVHVEPGRPALARVFVASSHEFDAATYAEDLTAATPWAATVRSLARAYSAPAPALEAPPLATHASPKPAESNASRPFYTSPWFWGALGAAALAGGTAYLLSRDSSPTTIHLQVLGP
jgi:hypothetical protein